MLYKALATASILLHLAFAQTTTAPSVQTLWGACGGIGFPGPSICGPSATCSTLNAYYAQCLPGPTRTTTSTSSFGTPIVCMPVLSCTTSLCYGKPVTGCVPGNSCDYTNTRRPSFSPCISPTTSSTTRCTTTSYCTPYLGCCSSTRTACAPYCAGQTPPTSFVIEVPPCPPPSLCPTTTSITTTSTTSSITTKTPCPLVSTCTAREYCCGRRTTSCISSTYCGTPYNRTIHTITSTGTCTCPTQRTTTTAVDVTPTAIVKRIEIIERYKGKRYGRA